MKAKSQQAIEKEASSAYPSRDQASLQVREGNPDYPFYVFKIWKWTEEMAELPPNLQKEEPGPSVSLENSSTSCSKQEESCSPRISW